MIMRRTDRQTFGQIYRQAGLHIQMVCDFGQVAERERERERGGGGRRGEEVKRD